MGSNNRVKHVLFVILLLVINFSSLSGQPISFSNSGSDQYLASIENTTEQNTRLNDNTVRKDPLDNFRQYRGGYDITNKHYWSSTAFTGIPGYTIGVLCLICGIGYLGFLLATATCFKKSRKLEKISPCHKQFHLLPLLFTILFTLLVITASGLVLGGIAKFHFRAKTVIDIIIDTADSASATIYNTTGAMNNMGSSLRQVGGVTEATQFLMSTSRRLDSQAANIERQASRNRQTIDKGLKIMYIIVAVIISLTLTTAVALLATGILKFQKTLQALIVLCWIFTVISWLLFGIFFFLHNFVGDTCIALESFQQDPYNNSLSSILPCNELLSAKSVLDDASSGVYDLINEVNQNISSSYGNIVHICNPFSNPPLYEYQPMNCSSNSIQIGDIPQVLRLLACPDSQSTTCNGGILIPATDYNNVEAYSTSIQTFLDVYPGMERLVECQTVNDAFSKILQNHCKPLKRNIRMVWASFIFLSVVMVALVLLWTIGEHHKKHYHSDGSVKHHSDNPVEVLESGIVKSTNDDSKPI